MWFVGERWELLIRELAFRCLCRHRQGSAPNILLYCSRRGGSTWLLNVLSRERGLRYVGRPLFALYQSRWRRLAPNLNEAAQCDCDHHFQFMVGISSSQEDAFRNVAARILSAELCLNPTLAFDAPFFQRKTNRVVFQMTSGTPMIGWFDAHFPIVTAVLFRHPISTALSIINAGWAPEIKDFLYHRPFCETYLTGPQMDLARRILNDSTGDRDLAAHVLDWTLKMLVPFRLATSGDYPKWATISYEELVQEPQAGIDHLCRKLELRDAQAMLDQARRPSRSVTKSTAEHVTEASYLVSRWRKKVTPAQAKELMEIPLAFDVDLYEAESDLPTRAFLSGE
jgi:hypothetical protein